MSHKRTERFFQMIDVDAGKKDARLTFRILINYWFNAHKTMLR